MSKAKQENYDLFLKKFMEETGKDEQYTRQLMSKLKRAENKLHRVYLDNCNLGDSQTRNEIASQLESHVLDLMTKFKTISTRFNSDPRGGAIRFVFKKTGWITTLGSDVAIDW